MAAAGFGTAMFRPTAIASLFKANVIAGDRSPESIAEDEAYWTEIQRAFDTDRTLINLNNGGVSPTPSHVLEAMIRDLKFTNELPVEHMYAMPSPNSLSAAGRPSSRTNFGSLMATRQPITAM